MPDGLLLFAEARFVIRQMQPTVMTEDVAAFAHLFNQQQYQRFIFHWQRHTSQTFAPRTRFIAMLLMISR
ncbi:Uncharacterised protein [Shigella sonnei]|nr:Uncharacterised protein [Shigella sonnei]